MKNLSYFSRLWVFGFLICLLFWIIETIIHYIYYKSLPEGNYILLSYFLITITWLSCIIILTAYIKQKTKLNIPNLDFKILDCIGNAALVTNQDNKIIYINEQYTNITGYTLDEVIGKNPNVLSSGKQDKNFYKNLWSTLNSKGYWEGEIWNRKKSGELFPEWINISAVKLKNSKPLFYIAIFSDITSKKIIENEVMESAFYDPLTKLYNRRFFMEQLNKSILLSKRDTQKFAVMFIDINGFKKINDQFGHRIGDEYLCSVANILKSTFRKSDVICRFGGDEFLIQLSNIGSKTTAVKFIKQFSAKIETTNIQIERHQFQVKLSIGFAIYPDDGLDAESLIEFADKQMYKVKKLSS